MPVVSTVFIYLITSSTGSTGGLQDMKITCVECQDCERNLKDGSKFIPQGVLVWQFAIFKIRGRWLGEKLRRILTKPLSRILRSRTHHARYLISNLGF